MNIGILANNYNFYYKFKNNESFNKYLNSLDIIFLIGSKGLILFNKNIIDKKKIVIFLKTNWVKEIKIIKIFESIFGFEIKKIHQNGNIMLNPNYKNSFYLNDLFYEYAKKYQSSKNVSKQKIGWMYINNNLIDKYLNYYDNSIILSGHLCILYCISKYQKENIYLFGYNYGKQFIDKRKKKTQILPQHNYDTNENLVNDLLKTYDNLKIINKL